MLKSCWHLISPRLSLCILRSQCFKTLSIDNEIWQCFILVKSGSSVNVAFSMSFITEHNKLECLNNLYLGLEIVRNKIGTRICSVWIISSNFRLVLKNLPQVNTVAYFGKVSLRNDKVCSTVSCLIHLALWLMGR